jgi:hypothetical protein
MKDENEPANLCKLYQMISHAPPNTAGDYQVAMQEVEINRGT